jgi:hypothetical protein
MVRSGTSLSRHSLAVTNVESRCNDVYMLSTAGTTTQCGGAVSDVTRIDCPCRRVSEYWRNIGGIPSMFSRFYAVLPTMTLT